MLKLSQTQARLESLLTVFSSISMILSMSLMLPTIGFRYGFKEIQFQTEHYLQQLSIHLMFLSQQTEISTFPMEIHTIEWTNGFQTPQISQQQCM